MRLPAVLLARLARTTTRTVHSSTLGSNAASPAALPEAFRSVVDVAVVHLLFVVLPPRFLPSSPHKPPMTPAMDDLTFVSQKMLLVVRPSCLTCNGARA